MNRAVFRRSLAVAGAVAGAWVAMQGVIERDVRGEGWNPSPSWQPYRELGWEEGERGESPFGEIRDASLCSPAAPSREVLAGWQDEMGVADEQYVFEAWEDAEAVPSWETFAFDSGDPRLWRWRVLPEGLIYRSYWAGAKESRMAGQAFSANGVWLLDVALGGRTAIFRYGSDDPLRPEGWELGIEGAAFPRLNLDENWDVDAVDFRFGIPLSYGRDNWQVKFAYYHLSAHMGDEIAIRENILSQRINYARDALVWGVSYNPLPAWRWYAEAAWAFYTDDGAKPWEFQFGVDIADPSPTGSRGTPFAAFNGHLREDVDFGGNLVVQAGWLWRGDTGKTFRLGFHYFNGKTNQFEFFRQFEDQIGVGIWQDF